MIANLVCSTCQSNRYVELEEVDGTLMVVAKAPRLPKDRSEIKEATFVCGNCVNPLPPLEFEIPDDVAEKFIREYDKHKNN